MLYGRPRYLIKRKPLGLTSEIYSRAIVDSLKKPQPAEHGHANPVMFVVEVGSVLTTGLWVQALGDMARRPHGISARYRSGSGLPCSSQNFSERFAEGRGKSPGGGD